MQERESLILRVDVVAHTLAVIIYAKQREDESWDDIAKVIFIYNAFKYMK